MLASGQVRRSDGTPTTPLQNLLPVETHPRPVEAIREMVFNQSKTDNFLIIEFSKKKTFSQLKLHTKKL